MRYVLDCSVAVKWFVPEPDSGLARRLLRDHGTAAFLAPALIVGEVGHAVRKLAFGKELTADQARGVIADFLSLGIQTVPLASLATDAIQLALDHSATFYDALYVAFAVREDLKVLTADDRTASAFAKLDRTLRLADFPTP